MSPPGVIDYKVYRLWVAPFPFVGSAVPIPKRSGTVGPIEKLSVFTPDTVFLVQRFTYTWRKDGAGWELRKSVYIVADTGIRKRRLPYVAHLSKSAFQEMKRAHKGAALEKAIAEWIAERAR